MKKKSLISFVLIPVSLVAILFLVYQLPPVKQKFSWRVDIAMTYLRGVVEPAGNLPTALPPPAVKVTIHPTATEIIVPTPTPLTPVPTPTPLPPTATPTALPGSVLLTAPTWEKQGPNNCGPATLTMYLRYYGWKGTQDDIASLVKPLTADRNVNVDELIYFTRTQVGWLNAEFRVGGNIKLLKSFLAAGIPVMIEEGMLLDQSYWPNDDLWAGHYLLFNGYDEISQVFIAQDSFRGANQNVSYEDLEKNWRTFNFVYILLYRPENTDTVKQILQENWDVDINRQMALDLAQAEASADPKNAFTWFNVGSNLVYFERYAEAGRAYDTARALGLPQRMLRYQFGPFFAYFFGNRNADLLALTDYALKITPDSEETMLWHGWGLYRDGEKAEAIDFFNKALKANPNYQDAVYALDYVQKN